MEDEFGLRKIEHEVLIAFLENIQVDNALDTWFITVTQRLLTQIIEEGDKGCGKEVDL